MEDFLHSVRWFSKDDPVSLLFILRSDDARLPHRWKIGPFGRCNNDHRQPRPCKQPLCRNCPLVWSAAWNIVVFGFRTELGMKVGNIGNKPSHSCIVREKRLQVITRGMKAENYDRCVLFFVVLTALFVCKSLQWLRQSLFGNFLLFLFNCLSGEFCCLHPALIWGAWHTPNCFWRTLGFIARRGSRGVHLVALHYTLIA